MILATNIYSILLLRVTFLYLPLIFLSLSFFLLPLFCQNGNTFTTPTTDYMMKNKRQVFPLSFRDETDEPMSQQLVDAVHDDDNELALELVYHEMVDVNYIGTVFLKFRKTELVLNGELASEVRTEFEEFRTDVTALFVAAHNGNVRLVRKLLDVGANVNQKLFRGYATTASVREGHMDVLEMLLNGGASQAACEEALLEASYLGRAGPAELLMASEMIRPHVAVHALVTASGRGYVDFVETLIRNGVDVNANARVLMQSSKPSLYANVDCNALVAAIVNRQVSVVQYLLRVGARADTKARLGAWAWDTTTGEECRVGAGLAEPYRVTWCAVEYYESSGEILRMLLHHMSPNIPHLGRTIIHHAILCNKAKALEVLLSCGADVEFPVETTDFRPIHLAARFGYTPILNLLINGNCNLNSRTGTGETALMICARHKHEECLKLLALTGADFGLSSASGLTVESIAGSVRWTLGFQQVVLDLIRAGKNVHSSNKEVFSSVLFVTRANDTECLKKLVELPKLNLDETDENGFSAVMVAAAGGHVEAFRLLVNVGANVEIHNKYGESAITIAKGNQNSEGFAKILSEYAYKRGINGSSGFFPLHHGVRIGNHDLVRSLISDGYDVNTFDSDGYTSLMLAAKQGDGSMCKLLISCGAECDAMSGRDETPLSLARKASDGSDAERVLLDELARTLVLKGAIVKKHTKSGKGAPHVKLLKMVEDSGLLRWGKSSRRNVICRTAEVGPSSKFKWNRRKKSDADDVGIFRVVTTKNREVHFSCEGGIEAAKLWVRGVRLVTRDAIFGRNHIDA